MNEALDRARLSLLGLSIGDALGHSLMWCAERIPKRREPPTPWSWSDDTEMALSIVATLEAHGRIDQDDLARRFASGFHEGRMYGPAMLHEYFPRVRAGESWRVVAGSLFGGKGSFGNGGAMRVAPLGAWFADDLERIVHEARLSAEVTHSHPEAVAGAVAVALAAACAHRLRGSPRPSEPGEFIERILPLVPKGEVHAGLVEAAKLKASESITHVATRLGNGSRVTAHDTVPFAVWSAARRLGDFVDAIWSTISVTGDMDTNAAIVGGIVAPFVGATGIPSRWVKNREPLPEPAEAPDMAANSRQNGGVPTPLDPSTVRSLLETARGRSLDLSLVGALDGAILPELPPPSLWLLIALERHERRQEWVGTVVRERLGGDLRLLGRAGAMGHPEGRPQKGAVPGIPEWEYFFHGKGCCLTHRVEGTSVDVDFDDDGGTTSIDLYFYSAFLESLRKLELPERRVWRGTNLADAWQADIPPLERERLFSGHRLTNSGRDVARTLAPVVERLIELERTATGSRIAAEAAWLAAALGDAELVLEISEHIASSEVVAILRRRVADQREHRARELEAGVAASESPRHDMGATLQALADLDRGVAGRAVLGVLARRPVPVSLAYKAVELVEQWRDRAFESAIRALLEHVETLDTKEVSTNYLRFRACRALFWLVPKDGVEPAARKHLVGALTRSIAFATAGEAGLLLCLLDPAAGMAALERELSHDRDHVRRGAAAALATIGNERARDALLRVLQKDDYWETLEAREALRRFRDREAWQPASDWEERHTKPPLPEGREIEIAGQVTRGYSMEDISRRNAINFIRYDLDRFAKEYGPLVQKWIGDA